MNSTKDSAANSGSSPRVAAPDRHHAPPGARVSGAARGGGSQPDAVPILWTAPIVRLVTLEVIDHPRPDGVDPRAVQFAKVDPYDNRRKWIRMPIGALVTVAEAAEAALEWLNASSGPVPLPAVQEGWHRAPGSSASRGEGASERRRLVREIERGRSTIRVLSIERDDGRRSVRVELWSQAGLVQRAIAAIDVPGGAVLAELIDGLVEAGLFASAKSDGPHRPSRAHTRA